MPAFYRVTIAIPMDSGLPNDTVNNVWSFMNLQSSVDRTSDSESIQGRLAGFYDDLANRFSSRVDLNSSTITVIDMLDSAPRVPVFQDDLGTGAEQSANMDFPPEVALCLSFKAAPGSGLNPRRRRGRIYLGPWQSSSTTDYAEILAADVTLVMAAATTNIADNNDDVVWAIYSPYTHHAVPVGRNINEEDENGDKVFPEQSGLVDDSFSAVATYWMDNAWDTQRRRGTKATARTTAAV